MKMLHKLFSRVIIALIVVMGLTGIPTSPAHSQATLNIAAIVNDDVISVYDLSQRIQMVIAFSRLPNTAETQRRIAPDVLRRLIAEKLRLQEAKRLNITIPDEQINNAIADLERQNKIPAGQMGQMLASHGIDLDSLKQQVNAELAWIEVVRAL